MLLFRFATGWTGNFYFSSNSKRQDRKISERAALSLKVDANITNTVCYKMVKMQSNDAENDAGYCNSPLPLI